MAQAKMATEDFHETAKSWATIKHTLLADYLRLFVGKTGYGRNNVYYVDAFVGPGLLDDGSKGSAIYAAEAASSPIHESRRDVLKCINIEPHPETFARLEAATAKYVASGHVRNLPGRFNDRREEVLEIIGDDPALFFIDPFGTEGAELNSLKQVKRRGAIREALVRYDDTRVKRLLSWAANNADSLDEAARKTSEKFLKRADQLTDESAVCCWLDGEPNAREALINGYIRAAREQGVFKFGIAYPVRNPDTQGHRYFLVHLCDFEDGYTWMANFMAAAEITYEQKREDLFNGCQQSFFSVKDFHLAARDTIVKQIIASFPEMCILRGWGKGVVVQNRKVFSALVDTFSWRVSRADYLKALKKLNSDGLLSFESLDDGDVMTFNVVP